MDIGVQLLGKEMDLTLVGQVAKEAEDKGLSSIWLSEYHRNAFVAAAVAAQATTNLQIGTAVSLAFPRSPLVTAMSTLDLDEVSGGRFSLGLGSQIKSVIEGWHGMEFSKPAARLGEYARSVRHILNGNDYPFEGEFYQFDTAAYDRDRPSTPPPVLLAGLKPLMTKAAINNADGILGHMLWSHGYVDRVVRPLLESAPAGFRRCISLISAVNDDSEVARRDARRTVAFYASTGAYRDIIAADGFEEAAIEARSALKAKDADRMESAIPDAMLDSYAIAGNPAEVADLLITRKNDFDTVILVDSHFRTPVDRLAEHRQTLFASLPALKAATR